MHIVILPGVPGSGKTSIANEYLGYEVLERDKIRAEMQGKQDRPNYKEWYAKNVSSKEVRVSEIYLERLKSYIEEDKNVVLSCTHLNVDRRNDLIQDIHVFAEVHGINVNIDVRLVLCQYDEIIERNALRENGVKPSVLYSFWRKLIQEIQDGTLSLNNAICTSKYAFNLRYFELISGTSDNKALKEIMIIDVDGTIADMGSRRPYEWDKVQNDTPKIETMIQIRAMVNQFGYLPVFVSGRDGICYDKTLNWIKAYSSIMGIVPKDVQLLMRPEGSMDKDTIVKLEILQELRKTFTVKMAFDDRPSVCRMWRDARIPVNQIGDPDKEF